MAVDTDRGQRLPEADHNATKSPIPSISVVMPVRNAERYVEQALESILTQTGVTYEIIVVDDGSTDCSPLILEDFARNHPNLQVVPGQAPGGISQALNTGIACAQGRYVARMDADDIALPGRLKTQFDYLEAHPHIGVLGAQAWFMDEHGTRGRRLRVPVGTKHVRNALLISAPFIHPTVMMRRDLVMAVDGYRPMFDTAEDYDLWLRLAPVTEFDNLDAPLLLYRRHAGQQTLRRSVKQARLTALSLVLYRLRLKGLADPLKDAQNLNHWDTALSRADFRATDRVHLLTAGVLADNGGSLNTLGARCLRKACDIAKAYASKETCDRLALACVRQQLNLTKAGRPTEALVCALRDILRWPWALASAYIRHLSIVFRCLRIR